MAITSGVNPHRAWLSVGGTLFPVIHGTAEQNGTRESSKFSATLPLNYPGAAAALQDPGTTAAGVVVQSNGKQGTLVMGQFTDCTFHYGQNGTIVASGYCNSINLHEKKTAPGQKWVNQTTTSIVSQLAGQAGLGVAISGGGGYVAGKTIDGKDYVKLGDGQSFFSIITKLAELDFARFYVDTSNVLHYDINPQTGGGVSVTYQAGPPEKADFLELSCKRNVRASQEISVTVESWHAQDKQVYTGQGQAGGSGGGTCQYGYNIPSLKQNQCQEWAQSKAKEAARHGMTIIAKVVGDPTVTVASGLQVNGTSFDGQYNISRINHTFGMGGHTMVVESKLGV